MRAQAVVRGCLVLAGLAIGLFGAYSLLRLGLSNLLWTVLWLAGGVIGNDGLLSGAALALLAVGAIVVPSWARAPVAAGFVILATVTIMAIPVLGRFGARPDNPTLLDRSYGLGWLVLAGIVAAGVVAASALSRHRAGARVKGEHG